MLPTALNAFPPPLFNCAMTEVPAYHLNPPPEVSVPNHICAVDIPIAYPVEVASMLSYNTIFVPAL